MGSRDSHAISGFTIIELLIALTIMMMMMVIGVTTFSFLADAWKKQRGNFDDYFSDYQTLNLVLSATENTRPYYITENGEPAFYFLGRDDGFTAVTSNSVTRPGRMAVYRVIAEYNDQQWQLIYEEAPLNFVLSSLDQSLPFNFRRVVLSDSNPIVFEYYGWENLQVLSSDATDVNKQWFKDYDGAERALHPLSVKVTQGDFVWRFDISDISLRILAQQSQDGL